MKQIIKWLCVLAALAFFFAAFFTKEAEHVAIGFLFLTSHIVMRNQEKSA